MTRFLPALLALLLAPVPAAAQVDLEANVLAGALTATRNTTFPAAPAVSLGTALRFDLPTGDFTLGISPFIGGSGTVALVEQGHELMATGRAGIRLDAPGYPRLFGFGGKVWPKTEPGEGEVARNNVVVGSGLSIRVRRVTIEGRYALDRRFPPGSRSTILLLLGSTF